MTESSFGRFIHNQFPLLKAQRPDIFALTFLHRISKFNGLSIRTLKKTLTLTIFNVSSLGENIFVDSLSFHYQLKV